MQNFKNLVILFLFSSLFSTLSYSQDTLVGWTFNNGNATDSIANFHNSLNTNRALKTSGGTSAIAYNNTGSPTFAAQATNWNNGKNLKCWQISFNSLGYQDLKVSSMQQAGNTYPGPRDFKIQYKVGNGNIWTDVPGGDFFCSSAWNSTIVNNLGLPAACNNQPSLVYLRWIMTSDTAINYQTVMATGRSKIDNIFITAMPFHTNPDTALFVIEYQANLNVGQQQTLTAMVFPSNADNLTVTWSSHDTSIAKVNSSGTVTARIGGNTYVKATSYSGFSDSCHVIVSVPFVADTSVSLSDTSITLTLGSSIHDTIVATVYPVHATHRNVSWASGDTSIVKVNSNGILTAQSDGQTMVTAHSYSGHTATCRINVMPLIIADTSVILSDTSIYLWLGMIDTLVATVFPINATDRSVTWFSSDTNVAKTDQNGVVYPVNLGVTYITVTTHNWKKDSCRVEIWVEGIHESQAGLFKLFPNPTEGKVFLLTNENVTEVAIFNGIGLKVLLLSGNHLNSVNLSGLPKGLYFIQLTTKAGKFNSKVFKE